MNKWKVAFWVCFIALLLVVTFSLYSILDQGVSLTYLQESYTETENDFEQIIEIVNETDLTKLQIQEKLREHRLFGFMNFESDTIYLDRSLLIFKNGILKEIRNTN